VTTRTTTAVSLSTLCTRLRDRIGAAKVVDDPTELETYSCDGLAQYRVRPGLVVLAADADDVQATVQECVAAGIPYVARGSGTGLSGGALPHAKGVLIVAARMRAIKVIDPDDVCAVVEPGVINLDVSRAAAPHGLHYAPDPSSQQICSIGGNVAENSGGAHCLKYGFTTNHVTGCEVVTPDGERVRIGGRAAEYPGYDLLGAFVGSEGTLGITTEVTVRLTRDPEDVRTLLAGFRSVDEAGAAVSAIIGAGVVPAAIEMMDALAIEAAEVAVGCGYPEGAAAVLLVEIDGPASEVQHTFEEVQRHCAESGAFEVRIAKDDTERALLWRGRKSAFAAVGRISPNYIIQDGVIPRTTLPEVLHAMTELASTAGVRVANVFHAGDGNLHPLVLFDASVEGEEERAEEVSGAILDLCITHGGSITGEHGVGVDKAKHMPKMFTEDDLDTMQRVRCAFDPGGLANPGKVFPTPRMCGEVPRVHSADEPAPKGVEVF
jgi:glycolate oxidase